MLNSSSTASLGKNRSLGTVALAPSSLSLRTKLGGFSASSTSDYAFTITLLIRKKATTSTFETFRAVRPGPVRLTPKPPDALINSIKVNVKMLRTVSRRTVPHAQLLNLSLLQKLVPKRLARHKLARQKLL